MSRKDREAQGHQACQELETELGNLNLQMRNKDDEEDPVPSNSSKALPGERIQFQMTLHDEEGGLDDAISAKGNLSITIITSKTGLL